MFKRLTLPDAPMQKTVIVYFNGRQVTAQDGDTIAAALLAAGVEACRTTPVSGSQRGPYCMMGVCFECLVEVDDVPNVQGCQVHVKDGMQIRSQHGARRLG
ncbi:MULTISPECIES: (2Fe-2S)-binding protein [unclassified Halomonas]|uniref:(2Fe-2S)-binding protein n=1 Tax=unclassified Halomonas TaxID=2609666 RepID=UPI002886EAEB|nr:MULTISPECIES: (2Fe-2S)-binding protein [unclassified Halomonas]MDT0501296.1 (2Fe-2S)-binding protein [Halomonas sp. PAR7]MDT0512180.1 (2Fe-2S)-binding protein [Halomonas sp. LES1]MDT0590683.1 (2Fe-2S)-binding protein [Halomonas sp. PAR8]